MSNRSILKMSIVPSQSFKRLLEETEQTPIEAIEECQLNYKRAESTHNQKIYEMLALAAAIVLKLRSSPQDRATFERHEFWEGTRSVPGDNSLPRRVLRFVLGAKTAKGTLYEQARTYAHVVSGLLDEGLSPPDILQRLSESSVYKVMALFPKPPRSKGDSVEAPTGTSAQRPVGKTQAVTDESISGVAPEVENEERGRFDDKLPAAEREGQSDPRDGRSRQPEAPSQNQGSGGGSGHARDRRPPFKIEKDVLFDAGNYFNLILDIEAGDEVTVTLRREANDKRWVKLRAINAERVLRSPMR